ncbi:MAG: hypothetical protein ABEJ46_03550 [Gemmatimonadota bacterium]
MSAAASGGAEGASPAERLAGGGGDPDDDEEREPCLRCGVRLMGCKGGHCPNCGHPYPHGDCSD